MLTQYILLKVRQSALFSNTQVAYLFSQNLNKDATLQTLKYINHPVKLNGTVRGPHLPKTFTRVYLYSLRVTPLTLGLITQHKVYI